MKKNKSFKKIKEELEKFNPGVEAAKGLGFEMVKNFRAKKLPDKTKYSKKERKKNKILI